jgi:hypothetical protein
MIVFVPINMNIGRSLLFQCPRLSYRMLKLRYLAISNERTRFLILVIFGPVHVHRKVQYRNQWRRDPWTSNALSEANIKWLKERGPDRKREGKRHVCCKAAYCTFNSLSIWILRTLWKLWSRLEFYTKLEYRNLSRSRLGILWPKKGGYLNQSGS